MKTLKCSTQRCNNKETAVKAKFLLLLIMCSMKPMSDLCGLKWLHFLRESKLNIDCSRRQWNHSRVQIFLSITFTYPAWESSSVINMRVVYEWISLWILCISYLMIYKVTYLFYFTVSVSMDSEPVWRDHKQGKGTNWQINHLITITVIKTSQRSLTPDISTWHL